MTHIEFSEATDAMREDLIETASRHCVVRDEAEDAVQEALLYCYTNLDKYDSTKASLKTWVTKVVIDRARDANDFHIRRHKREAEPEAFDPLKEQDPDVRRAQRKAADGVEPSYNPDYELRCMVKQALASLPPRWRNAVEAVYMRGEAQAVYAAERSIPLRTVEHDLAKAKDMLRRILRGGNVRRGHVVPLVAARRVA